MPEVVTDIGRLCKYLSETSLSAVTLPLHVHCYGFSLSCGEKMLHNQGVTFLEM